MKNHFLVLFLFLLILSSYTTTLHAQSKLLASVETIEIRSNTAPPAEKKKEYKKHSKKQFKKHSKKQFKKRFKKPNQNLNSNKISIRFGILFNLFGTASLATVSLLVAFLYAGSITSVFFIAVAGVCMFFSLIFLTIFLIYIAKEKRDKKNNSSMKG